MEKEIIKEFMLKGVELYSKALGMDVFDDSKIGENFMKLIDKYLENFE